MLLDLLKKRLVRASNLDAEFLQEDIDYGIRMIVSYSIIECIVLENPNDYN